MARYRMYKSGVFGHRYKGYYIVKNENEGKKSYSILGSDKTVLEDGLDDYYDAEWEIDKATASPDMTRIMQDLYSEDIYVLSEFFGDMMEKENKEGLTQDEKDFYEWVKKIRARKSANKPY